MKPSAMDSQKLDPADLEDDPLAARRTSRPCEIGDGEAPPGFWRRLVRRLRRRRAEEWFPPQAPPPAESLPDTLPEPPEMPKGDETD